VRRKLKGLSWVLLFALMVELVSPFVPLLDVLQKQTVSAAPDFGNASLKPYTDEDFPTKRYVVGFMYYEAWSNTKGVFTIGPGSIVGSEDLYHTYNFSASGRTITDVKVYRFDPTNEKHKTYFDKSRGDGTGQTFDYYEFYISKTINAPSVSNLSGTGTSNVTFKVSLSGELTPGTHEDMTGSDYCKDPVIVNGKEQTRCAPGAKVYRYYFPVVFEYHLNGQQLVQHFTTSGKSLSDVFPTKTTDLVVNQTTTVTVPTNNAYSYAGYKVSTKGTPTGSILTGNPPSVKFDGSFDTRTVYLYYEDEAKAIVKHVTESAASLASVFPDKETKLVKGQNYEFAAPTNANYEYLGFKVSTTGQPPASLINPSNYTYKLSPFEGNFSTMYLYHVYRLKSGTNTGEIKIRHMNRTGTTGSYTLAGEESEIVTSLPGTKTVKANEEYGEVVGYSLSFTGYSSTVTSSTDKTRSVSLTTTNKTAYVTFFYNKTNNSASYTADFTIVPNKIEYRETFSFVPKIVMNGCQYISHRYRITRDGSSVVTNPVYGINSTSTFPYANYPWLIGVGTHQVYIEVTTSCGVSQWIGPKTLDVTGPSSNRPPEFEIGFVYPYLPTVPMRKVVVGTVMDLIYIDDPTVPTPIDPDGDKIYFMGMDFSISSEWGKSIPGKYEKYHDGYRGIKMDTVGTHLVRAYMRDEFGATAVRTTQIEVVPMEPVAIITGPSEVVEGRPLKQPFSSSSSYSPIDRQINHSRDVWTNKKTVYDTPGKETITLHVYDDQGLRSIYPATHVLTVKEDLPPVPQLDYTTPMIRLGQAKDATFKVTSYSPDNDQIVEEKVSYVYDAGNRGLFGDQKVHEVKLNASREFTIPKLQVGRYKITVYAKEDWGKEASRTFDLQVINDKPLVSFEVSSESVEPVVIKDIPVSANTMVTKWKNYDYYGELPISWAVNPTTKALANLDYLQARGLDHIGPNPSNIEVIASPTNYNTSLYVYLYDDYWFTRGTYGISIYKGNTFLHTKNDVEVYSYSNVNYALRTIETRNYGRTHSRIYTFEEFVKSNGTYKEIASSQGFVNDRIRSKSYQTWTLGNVYNGGTLYFSEWSNPDQITGEMRLNTEKMNVVNGGILDALGRLHHYYRTMQGIYERYNIYDSQKETTDYLTNLPGNSNYYPSDDGKYTINGDGVVYRTDTGAQVAAVSSYKLPPSHYSVPVKDMIVMQHTTNHSRFGVYQWQKDGKLKLVTTLGDVFWDDKAGTSFTSMTRIDAQGYFYYTSMDKKLYRVNARTGVKQLITNLTDLWREDYDWPAYGEYDKYYPVISILGDGMLSFIERKFSWRRDDSTSTYSTPYVIKNETPMVKESLLTQQQLLGETSLSDATFQFSLRMNTHYDHDRYAGFGFHVQDNKNMYRVEANDRSLRLVKIVNGQRTELQKTDYAFKEREAYALKVQTLDGVIRVYVRNVPLLEVADSEFTAGAFGPYTEKPMTEFLNVMYADLSALSSKNKLQGIALVGEEMIYSTMYTDTEEDPAIPALTQWTYKQLDQKFLDAKDGKSGVSKHQNKSYTEPVAVMDKVGLYQVTYQTTDDPHSEHLHPDPTFADYRQTSNLASRQLIVHRAPTVDYDIAANPDGTIKWTDRSHDKDRYLTATNYSTEDTGIDYKATRGILQKKFYYVTPSGRTVDAKLVTPEEKGLYKVGMAVKDEYDAWSPFLERTIDVKVIPQADEPPVAGFTTSSITTYRGVPITITSTAYDKEDGPSKNLPHWYYIRNESIGGFEGLHSTARESWVKTFNSLGTFNIRQVVEDSLGQTDTYQSKVHIVNRKPVARVTVPESDNQNEPTKLTELRPEFRWTYTDADQDGQTRYVVRIYRYGGILEQESGELTGAALTWKPSKDLPEKMNLYIQVRVHDGIEWGDWSERKFFYIETNQPPVADFICTPNPAYEGDDITCRNRSTDPDGDELTYQWTLVGPGGYSRSYATEHIMIPGSVTDQRPGTYQVRLRVTDVKGAPNEEDATGTVRVLPLGLTAQVTHTTEWEAYRVAWNKANPKAERSPDTFWAGEGFVLTAFPTRTDATGGSETRAVQVKVDATSIGAVKLTAASPPSKETEAWSGYMGDKEAVVSLQKLQDGVYTFTFTVTYSNGVQRTTAVEIRIAGHWGEVIRIHRRY